MELASYINNSGKSIGKISELEIGGGSEISRSDLSFALSDVEGTEVVGSVALRIKVSTLVGAISETSCIVSIEVLVLRELKLVTGAISKSMNTHALPENSGIIRVFASLLVEPDTTSELSILCCAIPLTLIGRSSEFWSSMTSVATLSRLSLSLSVASEGSGEYNSGK